MRIAHVIDSMDIGGAEMVVLTLCRIHRQAGHALSVHCLFNAGALGLKLREEGIPVMVHGPASRFRMGMELRRTFAELRPDVVHCHNATASMVGAAAARLARVPAILSTRHGIIATPRRRRHAMFWLAGRYMDRVVAVCDRAAQNLAAAPFSIPEKLTTIWNGALPAPKSGVPQEGADGFPLVTVARLAEPKDHETLLRAVAIAKAKHPDLALWIIGDGPLAGRLKALSESLGISSCVQFLGERQDVGDWLRRARLFILSSKSEGVPISLLEALAAGLPFIVSATGGMPDIARMSEAGVVVPVGDATALAEAIGEYASQRRALSTLGARARQCYERHFTPEQMSDGYLNLYLELLPAGRQYNQTVCH